MGKSEAELLLLLLLLLIVFMGVTVRQHALQCCANAGR